jgi:HSP20 family protein
MSLQDLLPWNWGKKPVTVQPPVEPSTEVSVWRDVDQVFDDLFNRTSLSPWESLTRFPAAFEPRIDIRETDTAVKVLAELPGLNEKDIELTVTQGMLSIRGEKKEERDRGDRRRHWHEVTYGAFHRWVRLPSSVDTAKAEAVYKKGVLTVTLPKPAEAQKRRRLIPVRAN